MDLERTKGTLRSGIVAGLIACAVLVGGLWFLNNTRPGLGFKCGFLNDLGACLLYELSREAEPASPPITENPELAEERQRQTEELQRQQQANNAVAFASVDLKSAVDSLALVADAAADAADRLGDATALVRQELDHQQSVFDELAAMIAAGSTGDFWVDDVSFKLFDVEFARDDVDFAISSFEFDTYPIEDARTSRDQLTAEVDAAATALETAIGQYPNAEAAAYSVTQAQEDFQTLLSSIDLAVDAYEDALDEVDAMMDEADAILEQAATLAASVGAG